MLTKAIIQSVDYTKNICRVRIPLFETAARNVKMIEADAQFSIVPGVYNSYKTGDIVFIGFEENKMELPVILGKLFVSAAAEANSHRGNLSGNSMIITDTAQLPHSTVFDYKKISQNSALYNKLNTPKKIADSIIDLQRAQVQKYQTIIEVVLDDSITCKLYLKTSNDFTYSKGSSDEPFYRFCTALKNSQANNSVIPLDFALAISDIQTQIYPAALQINDFISESLRITLIIDSNNYEITKTEVQSISSVAIQY